MGLNRNNRAQLEAELAELQATVSRLEQERQEVRTRCFSPVVARSAGGAWVP